MSEVIFLSIIVILFVLDLKILHPKDEVISMRSSIITSAIYFAIGCAFGLYILFTMDVEKAKEYFTGFLIEKSLALDNIFVISIIFQSLKIPDIYKHRVLFWGIIGVIVFRAILITLGAAIISKFSWILYIFAIILFLTGIKIIYFANEQIDITKLKVYKFLQRHFNITEQCHGHDFVVKIDGKWWITPLFVALILIETMDLIFAFDSIPAIFIITTDPFIVYTSNIFAIIGLRALFFCLENVVARFKYVKYSLAIILIFISSKIFLASFYKIPTFVSLFITILLLISGVVISLVKTPRS